MYVCLCNGVSDKKIRQAVRQFQPQSFQQLRKFVPVGNQCGKCVRAAREIMQDELMQIPEFKTLNLLLGIVIMLLVGMVLLGGIKRIGSVSEKLVPFMALLYIVLAYFGVSLALLESVPVEIFNWLDVF